MSPTDLLLRLQQATNAHDVSAVVDCFTDDYSNETPAHPARGFRGREQVRVNWTLIFAGVPDVQARVLRSATVGETVWSEWEMSGTRRDGAAHLMRGVIIFTVPDQRAVAARFYLEPVDVTDVHADAAVQALLETPR
jgi:hypothetical protein